MENKCKRKSFTIIDKINILVQVDVHIGTHTELASWLGLSVSTLHTTVKNHEEIERTYVQCGPSYKQWKSLKCFLLEELEFALAAWQKQACADDDSIDGTHLKEKALHITAHPGIANILASNG
jgi:hypothetical protein